MEEQFIYGGTLANGQWGWNNDVTQFAPGGVTDAMGIGSDKQLNAYDGTGGYDLSKVNQPGGSSGWLGDSFSDFNKSMGSVGKIMGGVSSLANIYLGFKALGLAKEELGIKKDQWAQAKQELNHMRATRKRLTASYMGRSQGSKTGGGAGGGAGKSW